MRKKMKHLLNQRIEVIGTFVRFGKKNGWKGRIETTVLLKDIKDKDGNILSDHCWFSLTTGFNELNLKENDVVSFIARVTEYQKGYYGYKEIITVQEIDYKLSYPTHIKKVS